MTIAGALVALGALALAWGWIFWKMAMGLASRRWPTASGTMRLAAAVWVSHRGRGGYDLRLSYDYTVNGRTYTGTRLSYDVFLPGRPLKIKERYRIGTPVAVHYRPSNPTQSVLEPGWGRSSILFALFVLILSGVLVNLAFCPP